jgi:hypothetical protein
VLLNENMRPRTDTSVLLSSLRPRLEGGIIAVAA